jgi:hypothetical protein
MKFSVGILLPSRMMLYYRDGFVVGILLGNRKDSQETRGFSVIIRKTPQK